MGTAWANVNEILILKLLSIYLYSHADSLLVQRPSACLVARTPYVASRHTSTDRGMSSSVTNTHTVNVACESLTVVGASAGK